jgi:hypothetical protein
VRGRGVGKGRGVRSEGEGVARPAACCELQRGAWRWGEGGGGAWAASAHRHEPIDSSAVEVHVELCRVGSNVLELACRGQGDSGSCENPSSDASSPKSACVTRTSAGLLKLLCSLPIIAAPVWPACARLGEMVTRGCLLLQVTALLLGDGNTFAVCFLTSLPDNVQSGNLCLLLWEPACFNHLVQLDKPLAVASFTSVGGSVQLIKIEKRFAPKYVKW